MARRAAKTVPHGKTFLSPERRSKGRRSPS